MQIQLLSRYLLILLYSILWPCSGYAQSNNAPAMLPGLPPRTDLSLPSPTVASLGKFGLTPVSYYTGVPQVSIPIWEVKSKKLRLPVSLNYNNNGLKVTEDASWVGLGWGLQAGGVITQMVRGIPDDSTPSLAYTPPTTTNSTFDSQLLLNRVAQGLMDGSPDVFVFNFAGYSGQFILYQNTAYQISYTDLQIEYAPQTGYFTITTGAGTIYKFFKTESTTNIVQNGPTFGSVSWLLTEITSADKTDTITLTYDSTPEQYTMPMGHRVEDSYQGFSIGSALSMNTELECRLYDSSTPGQKTTFYSSTTTGYRLTRIESQAERLEFVPQPTKRLDVNGTAYALASIRVYDKARSTTTPLRSFNLQQGYFSGGTSGSVSANLEFSRLKLEGVQEIGESGLSKPPYLFDYQGYNFPSRFSRDLDHWGFFNAAGNTSLLPATLNFPQGTANRTPNFQATQLGTLQKITYPTGGFEAFTYEQNRFYPSADSVETDGPGLRVRRIMAQSATGVVTYRNFTYTAPLTERLIPEYEKTTINNPGTECDCLLVTVSGSNPDILTMFGSVVLYTNVTETLGDKGAGGQTDYEYEWAGGAFWSNEMRLKKKVVRTATKIKLNEETYFYGSTIDLSLPIAINATPSYGPYVVVGNATRVGTQLPGTLYYGLGCLRKDPNCGGRIVPELEYKIDPTYGYMLSIYYPSFLNINCIWGPLARKEIRTYDPINTTAFTTLATQYYYDQGTPTITGGTTAGQFTHRYVTREETTNSQGQTYIKRSRYPQDYVTTAIASTDSYYNSLQQLVNMHQVESPVEQVSLVKTGNTTIATGGQLTLFKAFGLALNIQPAKLLNLETNAPLPDAAFSATNGSVLSWDSHFMPRFTYRYDTQGNRIEGRNNQQVFAYLYNSSTAQVLAGVQNAQWTQIASTSFEPHATGRWVYDSLGTHIVPTHFTGSYGYQLDGTATSSISRPSLPAGQYDLLFWSYGSDIPIIMGPSQQWHEQVTVAGAWQQHRFHLTLATTTTLQLNATVNQVILLDALRLYPIGAQMTSYTQEPLIGLTSQTDPSGHTLMYEYDGLGRLICTRDEQGRILSQQQYHYAGK